MTIDTTKTNPLSKQPLDLEIEFRHGETHSTPFHFRQIAKSDKGYIYEVEHGQHYEVFKRKTRVDVNGDVVIAYPGNEAFGYWAWTYASKERAIKKFKGL